jgi:hypothetical protein
MMGKVKWLKKLNGLNGERRGGPEGRNPKEQGVDGMDRVDEQVWQPALRGLAAKCRRCCQTEIGAARRALPGRGEEGESD